MFNSSFLYLVLTFLWSLSTFAACNVNQFLKSSEGQEKLNQMSDSLKALVISKLTDLEIKESDIDIAIRLLNKVTKTEKGQLEVNLKNHDHFSVWGEEISVKKTILKTKVRGRKGYDFQCGAEIIFFGGNLLNKRTGQDFGSLGRVKEFVRLN